MLCGKYLTAAEVYDGAASPADMTDSQMTCYNSLKQVSLKSISLKAFTCDIYIIFWPYPKVNN